MTELMLEFYRQMRRPGRGGQLVSKVEALRQAQLKLLRADADAHKYPYHWGGAILIRDWR
jgi:CHAT domain-containing protein